MINSKYGANISRIVRNVRRKNKAKGSAPSYIEARRLFDAEYYNAHNVDVAFSRRDPFDHYIEYGWKEGRDPSASFSTNYYLNTHTDVARSGRCPLLHYAEFGLAESRSKSAEDAGEEISPSMPQPMASAIPGHTTTVIPSYIKDQLTASFDKDLYLRQFRGIQIDDALQHYLDYGWREGAVPNRTFDARDYLDLNPDVAAASVHPFIHYVATGQSEGRVCKSDSKFEKQAILRAVSNEQRTRDWYNNVHHVGLDLNVLIDKLTSVLPVSRSGIAISLSHDNYLRSVGGVQIYISDEQKMFNRAGWCYFHLSPVVPMLGLSKNDDAQHFLYGINFNGAYLGISSAENISKVLQKVEGDYPRGMHVIIHSLIGSNARVTADLILSVSSRQNYFFAHDFSAICANHTLLRNDVEFCNAPAIDSTGCRVCVYSSERADSVKSYQEFFSRVSPTFVFPSNSAKQFWDAHSSFEMQGNVLICEHAVAEQHGLPGEHSQELTEIDKRRRSVRVAFVGAPLRHKGFDHFKKFMLSVGHRADAEFFILSHDRPEDLSIAQHIPVSVSGSNRHNMVDVLKSHEIDVVIMWSLCFETFSFTTLESIVSGAFVLARRHSGNVDVLIKDSGFGRTFESMQDLVDYFNGPTLDRDISYHRATVPQMSLASTCKLPAFVMENHA